MALAPKPQQPTNSSRSIWYLIAYGALITLVSLAVVELVARTFFRTPTLTVLLIVVAYVAFKQGLRAGLLSAVLISLYGIYYFSSPGPSLTFTSENAVRLIVLVVTSLSISIMLGILRRTTERSQEELRQQLSFIRAINNSLSEAVYASDREGRITFVNAMAEQLLGQRASRLRDRPVGEVIPVQRLDGAPVVAGHVITMEYFAPIPVRSEDYVLVRPDGSQIPISYASAPIQENGDVIGSVVAFRDISHRKQAEQRLLEVLAELQNHYTDADRTRAQIRAVLDAAGEVMILVAPDRRFLMVNRRFTEFLGVEAEEVIGRRFEELQPIVERAFADPAALRARVADTAGNPSGQFTMTLTQAWPVQRELEMSSTPVLNSEGEYIGRLYVLRDVTHEREIDRMKSEFVSLVSHELRTPLTSIKGYVDLVLEGDVGPVSEEQQEFLGIVKNNADRLVALINDLLDVSRIEAGKIELRCAYVNLEPLVRQVATSFRPQIEGKAQRLVIDLPPALPPVLGDADRITQILTNLVSNAHKYTPAGGTITITVESKHDYVRVHVQDTGIGMSVDEQQKLFTKFFRARNRTTQEVGGTGLGLAITRSLVEIHGGEITVASVPGQGSTFSFTLPSASEPSQQNASPTAFGTGGLVLVVDDEPDIAGLVRRYLERAGYEVLVAHTAADALAIAQVEQPDLITLDIMLPDSDGFTLLEWLKSDSATAAIPVLLLSIMDEEERGKLLGAVDYVRKPVEERTLVNRIGIILGGERNRRVLVADDDDDIRALIVGQLRRAGYDTVAAVDGEDAVRLARTMQPDLALIDIRMPKLDGVCVLQTLRADAGTRDIPVVMMTASPGAFDENRSVLEELGATLLLSKPYTPEELADIIARGLANTSTANT